jgi:hypothetical protein
MVKKATKHALQQAIAGTWGSLFAATFIYPLDVVKVRIQAVSIFSFIRPKLFHHFL